VGVDWLGQSHLTLAPLPLAVGVHSQDEPFQLEVFAGSTIVDDPLAQLGQQIIQLINSRWNSNRDA
jgi:hypothetical protein